MPLIDLGKPFQLGRNAVSDSRFNAKMWNIDTSSNLFNSAEKIPGQFMLPTTSGDGLTKNQPCFRSVDDADIILPVGLAKHTHALDTDLEGGLLVKTQQYNIGNINSFYAQWFSVEMFHTEGTGTGFGVSDDGAGLITIDAGTTTDSYASIRTHNLPLGFDDRIFFMHRADFTGPFTNYLMKFGVNVERVNDANSNSTKSLGWEACSGNSNWLVLSCDGTTRSTTTTSIAVATNDDVFEAQHYPADPAIQFKFNHGSTTTKTTNIPTSGDCSPTRGWIEGIQSTTSSEAKSIQFEGLVIHGTAGPGDWEWYIA